MRRQYLDWARVVFQSLARFAAVQGAGAASPLAPFAKIRQLLRVKENPSVRTIAPGVWAAALTPLNETLSIDAKACTEHARWLLAQGCAGVVALGTTGEANSFTVAERLDLIGALGASGLPADRIMVGTGCCAVPDTIALTRAALDAGFVKVLMLPPFYYKQVSNEGLFRAYADVIEAVAEPRLRVIVYDIPQQTGFKIGADLLIRLAAAFAGVVAGLKDSSGDWSAMQRAADIPAFQVFPGSEQFLLASLRAGWPGCISAVANVTAATLAELVVRWRDDDADARQAAIARTRQMLQPFPIIPALKEILAHATGRSQWRGVRPPLVNLSAPEAARLLGQARDAGLIE
jgi:4-hydroxy-tetrahydrodipicolinate synthase